MKGLILVYILTVVGVVGAFRAPVIGLFVYIGFAVLRPRFMFGWAGDVGDVSWYVAIAMLASWAMNGFGDWKIGRGKLVVWTLLLFTLWCYLSALQANYSNAATSWVIAFLKVVAPFLVGVTTLNTEKHARAMMWTMVLVQGYIGYEMNYQYLINGRNQVADSGYGGMDNNSFGISLVTTIGPALAMGLAEKDWRWKAAGALSAAFMVHTTLLTFSRGAMVGLAAVGFAAFVILPKRPKYIAAMVVTLLLTARFTGEQLLNRYESAFAASDRRDSSADSRLLLWRDCFEVAMDRPILGIGPNNWPLIASSFGWTPFKSAHSVWFQTLAETGFPGVFLLFSFFVLTMIRLWPLAREKITEENRYLVAAATGIITAIVGFMVAGSFVSLTGLEHPYYMAMMGVVILKDTVRESAAKKELPHPPRPISVVQRRVPERAPRVPRPAQPVQPLGVRRQGI